MKESKYKNLESCIEEYLQLYNDKMDMILLIGKEKEKQSRLLKQAPPVIVKKAQAEELFSIHRQIRVSKEKHDALSAGLNQAELCLKEYLSFLGGKKIQYEKKDKTVKGKLSYLFELQNGNIECTRTCKVTPRKRTKQLESMEA